MSASENPQRESTIEAQSNPEDGVSSFGDFDVNVVQISDTEDYGLDYEEVASRYEEGEVDILAYAGDASKKNKLSPEEFVNQFDQTYKTLDKLAADLNAEVVTLPGNHAPISGVHAPGGEPRDIEYMENVGAILEDDYEEFASSEGNAYEFLVGQYDNLTNLEMDSLELENITLVGGTHHIEEETEREFLNEDPCLGDIGYDGEELSEELTRIESYNGLFSKIPLLGGLFSEIFRTEYSPDTTELTLDDLPDDKERTRKHESFEQALEFKHELGSIIEEANNDVYMLHHGFLSSGVEKYGSTVVDKLVEEYSDELALVGGGHTGEAMADEFYDVPGINTNDGYAAEIGIQDGEVAHLENFDPTIERTQQQNSSEVQASQIDEAAKSIPDEQVDKRLVTEISEQEGISQEKALEEAKKFMVAQSIQAQQHSEESQA